MNHTDPTELYVRFVTESQRALYAYILAIVQDMAAADDVLGETNMVLWRKRGDFRPESGTGDSQRQFLAFAHTIAKYQALAHLRARQRNRLRFDDGLLGTLADEAAERSGVLDAKRRALGRCLAALAPIDRELIEHRYLHDRRVNEIAASVGRTANAISQALHRIRNALTRCVSQRLGRRNAGEAADA